MDIAFKFSLESKVKTRYGETGFVESALNDGEGLKYWIRTAIDKGGWVKESDLESAE